MHVSLALLTRDLRVTDNPVLASAAADADRTIVLYVLDPRLLAAASPNRRAALHGALQDLRASLRFRGSDLVVRRGRTEDVVPALARDHGVNSVHVARDASRAADARQRRLALALPDDLRLEVVDSHWIVAPGAVAPSGNDHYRVFTPYLRSWLDAPRRPIESIPDRLPMPAGLDAGDLPSVDVFAQGPVSSNLPRVAESSALARAEAFLSSDAGRYADGRDVPSEDGTSKLSADLHFGTLSARWLEERLDLRHEGHQAFRRQLCWRDFNMQLLDTAADLAVSDWRARGDQWRDDPDDIAAWKAGETGYPLVDAGMRQLMHEGWMHNRIRMVVASFLVKSLYVDWRVGLEHFNHWLVDADLANNAASWQWVAGTGADSRPNRVLNPVRQAERFDPKATYIRRWVPELRDVDDDRDAREPWRLAGTMQEPDYPAPIVDLDESRARFLEARNA